MSGEVGMPLIVPVEVPSESPGGSEDPLGIDQVKGAVPPLVVSVWE